MTWSKTSYKDYQKKVDDYVVKNDIYHPKKLGVNLKEMSKYAQEHKKTLLGLTDQEIRQFQNTEDQRNVQFK